ncbi:MAG: lysozyme inhibitor LprI family protein [Gallionellaceae bacterium]|nr:lysozyme inhibitor LprI family protein [Gallionellaceae bacterium]
MWFAIRRKFVEEIMNDYVAGILTALLPAAGIAIWYLLRRYNEKQPLSEAIDRAQRTAELKKTLDQHNFTLDDLKELQEGLMGRAEVAKKLSTSFAAEAGRISEMLMSNAMTQMDMNEAASRAYDITNIKLEHVISEIKKYFEPTQIESFDETQAIWREYQKKNAEFSASQYEGGSIQPLIYASALEKTAISRLVELEEEFNFMKDVLVPYNEREEM